MQMVKKCAHCQIFGNLHRIPGVKIELAKSTWPFDQWGIDLVGPFPPAQGQRKLLVVAVDHFTKWIKTEPVAWITESAMIQFVWRNIICRFGVPRKITSDNCTQFQGKKFRGWCAQWKIKQIFMSVGNPKTNSHTEVSNCIILQNLKTKLGSSRSRWVDEILGVLWAYRTTSRVSSRETPFSLVYGSEALIPAEIVEPTIRMTQYEEQDNNTARLLDLDLIEEQREITRMRLKNYKRRIVRSYNSTVKERTFQVGELVLQKIKVQRPVGKLEPKWEGPYKITEIRREGTYKLATLGGQEVPRSWTIQNLKKYYC
ncbi:UNVERIFIED_CONTAM: hypothetical protein Slati_2663600 [Sesamum latifolium]|uniref:Integrase catalytic domain-containing protein n=1 Tax=Sesamum latifolium TaxID=2727402 RepID=A0AAW2VVR9_9LAMI